jgi:hypothetical protein
MALRVVVVQLPEIGQRWLPPLLLQLSLFLIERSAHVQIGNDKEMHGLK